MAFTREQYGRKQTLDVRSAMAVALARRLREAEFLAPVGGAFRFSEVFESWPDYGQRYVPPAACVLPSPVIYDAARLTPTLMEDTWEPQGGVGFGLYKTADIAADFEVNIRTASAAERNIVMAAVENLWTVDGMLMDQEAGPRYGIVVAMPEYFGVCAGFALKSARVIDNEDMAMREHREVVLVVNGQAPQVKLGPVRPMNLTVRLSTC